MCIIVAGRSLEQLLQLLLIKCAFVTYTLYVCFRFVSSVSTLLRSLAPLRFVSDHAFLGGNGLF